MWKKTATLEKSAPINPTSKSKVAVASGPGDQTQSSKPVSVDGIRFRAHQKWEAAGMPDGDDLRFWLEAEREVSLGK